MSEARCSTALRFAINLGNPVLAFISPSGEPEGISVALARRIAQALGAEAQFTTYPTAGSVVAAAQAGEWDIAFLARDPARAQTLRFTESYITIQGTMMVAAEADVRSVAQMDSEGLTINVGKGAAYDLWLTRNFSRAVLLRQASSQAAIDAFLNGEGDAVAGIRQPLEKAARQNAGYRVLEDNFTQIEQAVCVPLGDERYFAEIAGLINQLKESGEAERIINENMNDG